MRGIADPRQPRPPRPTAALAPSRHPHAGRGRRCGEGPASRDVAVTGPRPVPQGPSCTSLKPLAARPQLSAAGRQAPPHGGLGSFLFKRISCCSRTRFRTQKSTAWGPEGAAVARRAPRCRLSPEPGVWGQRRPRPAPAARRRRGEAPRLLPGPVPLSAAPGPTSRRGRSVWRHLPAHRKQQRQRQKKREHREGCGKRRNSPRRAGVLLKSFLFTSHLDKILITAPKLSALTFVKAAPPAARPRWPSAFLPALPSMEVNFEYMIYLAG